DEQSGLVAHISEMISGSAAGKKQLMLIGSAVAVFAVFGREEGGKILAEPGLRDGVVEDPHVVGPVAVAAAIGVAIEIDITGKVIATLAGVDVGLVELVIAGRAVIKQHDF